MYQLVLRFARRLAAKPDKTGIMQISNNQAAIDTANDILTKFKKHGVPNETIKSENDVKVIYNQIQEIENQVFTKNLKNALKPKKSAEVVDLTGKKIDTSKPILGGKNVPEEKGFSMTIAEGPQTGKNITMDEFFEMSGAKSNVKQIFMSDKDFKDLRRSFRMNITKNDRQFNQDLTQQIVKREIYTDLSKGQRKNLLDDLDQVLKGDQGLAHGGRTGTGLNYLLGEDDQNSRVPYAEGKTGFSGTADEWRKQNPSRKELIEEYKASKLPPKKRNVELYPRASVRIGEEGLGNDFGLGSKDTTYGGAIIGEKDGLYGGIDYLKIKNKIDFMKDNQTLFKDTTDDEIMDFILGKKGKYGDIRLKADKDLGNAQISWNWKLNEGGRVPYSKGSRKKSWTDRIAGWTGGTNVMAGEIGLETWDLLNNLLQSGGLYAEGGRIGFGLGGIDKARRLFLKWAGAGAATTAAAKSGLLSIFKGGTTKSVVAPAVHHLNQVKAGVDGMPAWFKPLVNKVIKEGNQVESGAERAIVHKTKLPDSKTDVYVTQELDSGNVMVDIGIEKHGWADGRFGQPVRLEYKASELIEPTVLKGETPSKRIKTKEEFNVEEAEFTGGHPENVKFEDVSVEKFGKHASNFDEVEAFATGKIKKTRKISSLQKEGEDLADHFSNYPTPDDFASGGRVPMVFGGRTIGVLKNLFTKMKKSSGIPRGEKSLKPDRFAKSIMSEEDKLKLLQLETKYANSMLESLKIDRQFFKQLETNKEMKDQGLDFLMKNFVDTQAPHMKNYKSLADIDQAILELETLVKNKTLKEGRKLNATGGRVPLVGGGLLKLWKLLRGGKTVWRGSSTGHGIAGNFVPESQKFLKGKFYTEDKKLAEYYASLGKGILKIKKKTLSKKELEKAKRIGRYFHEEIILPKKLAKEAEIDIPSSIKVNLKKFIKNLNEPLADGGIAGMLGE